MIYYKYRKWNDYTKDILLNDEFWFAKPNTFNDPFDCQIRVSRHDINEALAIDFLGSVFPKNKQEKASFYNKAYNQLSKHRGVLEEVCDFLRDRIKEFEEYFDSKGVLSLSEESQNMLMWGHYGDSHTGIAIGLSDEGDCALADSRMSKPVVYSDQYPLITARDIVAGSYEDWDVYADLILHTKSEAWAYEKEKRVILNEGGKLFKSPGKISEIILGARASKSTIKEVRKICQDKSIKLRQAVLKSESFSMVVIDGNLL